MPLGPYLKLPDWRCSCHAVVPAATGESRPRPPSSGALFRGDAARSDSGDSGVFPPAVTAEIGLRICAGAAVASRPPERSTTFRSAAAAGAAAGSSGGRSGGGGDGGGSTGGSVKGVIVRTCGDTRTAACLLYTSPSPRD